MGLNVLITGGAGFIGSRLGLSFAEAGHEVTLLDSFSPQVHGEPRQSAAHRKYLEGFARVIVGDVTSRRDVESAISDQQVIVHLAAETGTGQSMYKIQHYSEVNIGGTALLLDVLANQANDVQKFVVASSRSIYGEGRYQTAGGSYVYPEHRDEDSLLAGDFDVHSDVAGAGTLELVATDEESKLHPSSVYGITKLTQEQLVMTVCPTIGIASVALRYQNVYGPGQSLTNPYTGILSIFSSLIRQGKSVNIFEDGAESRDFVFVDDVVAATKLAALDDRANNRVFNVGSGVPTTVMQVVEHLLKHYEAEVPVEVSGNFRLGDIRHNFADIQLIKDTLGFEPRVSFGEGISRFAAWVATQEELGTMYEQSIAEMREKNLLK
jgi:dTDP-L-rhamnose 4-epimerase